MPSAGASQPHFPEREPGGRPDQTPRPKARSPKPEARSPQTNGMVERFNGRIEDVLRTHRFIDGQDMKQTIERYVHVYNHQLPSLRFNPEIRYSHERMPQKQA